MQNVDLYQNIIQEEDEDGIDDDSDFEGENKQNDQAMMDKENVDESR